MRISTLDAIIQLGHDLQQTGRTITDLAVRQREEIGQVRAELERTRSEVRQLRAQLATAQHPTTELAPGSAQPTTWLPEPPPTVAPVDVGSAKPPTELECCRLQDGVTPLKKRDGIPAEVYSTALLEHPAVPGLILTLPQRIYGTALEIKRLDDGEIRFETADEKRFRVMWKKPIPISQTRTSGTFATMDESLFAKK